MLKPLKISLRLIDNTFDAEIKNLISACKSDLELAGVVNIKDDDPLIIRAVTLYAKGHFGFADMGVKFLEAYEMLKLSLRRSSDYNQKK